MRKENITKKQLKRLVLGKSETKIINLLSRVKSETVNKIAAKVDLDQPTTSQILKRFLMFGIVENQRSGKFVHYSINHVKYQEVVAAYTDIDISEKAKIKALFKGANTKQRDPLVYKQKSPIVSNLK